MVILGAGIPSPSSNGKRRAVCLPPLRITSTHHRDSGIVTAVSGSVTIDSGFRAKIGHDPPESPVTFRRNPRSRSIGMGGHDAPQYALHPQKAEP